MAPTAGDWVGQVLLDRYKVYRRLADEPASGSAIGELHRPFEQTVGVQPIGVYLADDLGRGRKAVIKACHETSPTFQDAFRQAFAEGKRFSHQRLVAVLECAELDGHPFAVMDYLQGGNIVQYRPIDAAGIPLPMQFEDIRQWLGDVADVLDTIHAAGLVHQEIRPANILFDLQKAVCLGHSGLYRPQKHGRQQDSACSERQPSQYLAPEWVEHGCFDSRSDQYAFAVLVHELLAGRTPRRGGGASRLAPAPGTPGAILNVPAPASGVASAVLRAMSEDPRKRYASCGEFFRAMEQAAASREATGDVPFANPVDQPSEDIKPFGSSPFVQGPIRLIPPSRWRTLLASRPLHWTVFALMLVCVFWVGTKLGSGFLLPPSKQTRQVDAEKAQSEIVNGIGMKLRLIPAGEFMMGSPDGEGSPDEHPQHRVRISKPFYLGAYEVTQREYEQVMGTNPSWFSAKGRGAAKVSGQDASRFPVEQVSWDDAVEFCRKLSAKEGKRYRLPTEAEWEYACRAGSWGELPVKRENDPANEGQAARPAGSSARDSLTPAGLPGKQPDNAPKTPTAASRQPKATGNRSGHFPPRAQGASVDDPNGSNPVETGSKVRALSPLDAVAWYKDNSQEQTHPVGTKKPNAWGLFDMQGNVSEWCWDAYHPYQQATLVEDPRGPMEGKERCLRGGSWDHSETAVTCTSRIPGAEMKTWAQVGFRVVMEVPESFPPSAAADTAETGQDSSGSKTRETARPSKHSPGIGHSGKPGSADRVQPAKENDGEVRAVQPAAAGRTTDTPKNDAPPGRRESQ